jgi:hypothetical protein
LSPFEKKGEFLQPVLIPHDPIALPSLKKFEKEGPGEISAVTSGITSAKKSP